VKINFKNFIQIAGVIDQSEANLLTGCGVEYLGFPLRLPVNKEDLTEKEASEIINNMKDPDKAILITYLSDAYEIIKFCNSLGTRSVQLHGPVPIENLKTLRELQPDFTIIKSLVINDRNEEELTENVIKMQPFCDAFITDTFDPSTGASGATGKTHDWDISKSLVQLSSKPVILAGGLNAENVYEAILHVNPAGVDTHTGVEDSNGRKNKSMVKEFVRNANLAFNRV
jgi:phosphoribosylanthranilate isomerase